MASISVPTALAIAGGVGAAGSVASSIIGSNAASSAAQTQANAANRAADTTLAMFNKTQANLQPFITAGTGALTSLQSLTGTNPGGNPLTAPLTTPFQPTQAQLEATPGYQFTLSQGLKGVTNQYAALGLGPGVAPTGTGPRVSAALPSGPLGVGLETYASGLASQTYQQQFQNYLAQNQQIYNMLGGITSSGQSAAANLGSLGIGFNTTATNLITGGAAATAGGIIGSANALTAGIGGVSGNLNNAALMLALNNSGIFGGAGGGAAGAYPPALSADQFNYYSTLQNALYPTQ